MALSPTLLDRDHAVTLMRPDQTTQVFRGRYDPVLSEWVLFHPDPDVAPLTVSHGEVWRRGGWNDNMGSKELAFMLGMLNFTQQEWTGLTSMTWAQYAAHQWGQVLRQRDLVDRLKALDVDKLDRRHRPHGWDQGTLMGATFYSLQLNYDELDALLTLAEQPRSSEAGSVSSS